MWFQRIVSIAITLGAVSAVAGQTLEDSVLIHFRQSKVDLDTTYMNNREALDHVRQQIKAFHRPDSDLVLLNVEVTGGASPEGSVRFNEWLSKERAARIYDYMDSRMILPDSVTSRKLLGRDWRGLLRMVEVDPSVPYRDEVIELLGEIIAKYDLGETELDHNLRRLKELRSGEPYLYLYRHQFPYLREANIVLTFGRPLHKLDYRVTGVPFDGLTWPDGAPVFDIVAPKGDRPFYMALKTNMIADLLALPEIGAEFYLGKYISVVGNWMYGWWDKDRTHRYWRAYGGDLAVRWWFGRAAHDKPLTGHHVGVYGGVVTYDFEFGGKGYMGGLPGRNLWDRCMHYFGAEYGYSLPIKRRLNIDFTLGLGYMGGKYIEYVPKGRCYCWQATKRKHWYGPTKLEVSLVWLIGHGNYNQKR